MRSILFVLVVVVFCLLGCKDKEKKDAAREDLIEYSIVKIFTHDKTAFTQGLVVEQGRLFESTGQHGTSWIAEVDIATGLQDKKVILDKKYFGEGITILNNKIFQLTWQTKVGFIYDLKTFEKIREFEYNREGWGITHNGHNLIVSDGTDQLYFLDTLSLEPVTVLKVKDGDVPAEKLNELEFIDGFIFANQWQTNFILKIDPVSGQVVGSMDMTELAEKVFPLNPNADVLNGIAYEKKSKMLLVTGKLWPAMVAVKFK
ncbi:MAG: glutaminyl-peptide cyclotransferase [Cyclobacteriaceae bacterium]|nr:glutaminyl-peptide cyclotransferase [Cyclobacteriaceae bacterium]